MNISNYGIVFFVIFFLAFNTSYSLLNEALAAKKFNQKKEHPAYERLNEALEIYEKIKVEGGRSEININNETFSKGDSSEVIKIIKERLTTTGDFTLNGSDEINAVFDEELVESIERFQSRHGIQVDGVLGPNTIEKMNIPVEEKIEKIMFSLESWRNLPDELGEKYIFVNIPEFRLQAYENKKELLNIRIVVGDQYDGGETPTFNDSIEFLIFNPYWNIPHSIVLDQILPNAREDINYLERGNYEIVNEFGHEAEIFPVTEENLNKVEEGDLLVRQKPGSNNSMGQVKFMFPNQYAIYLHDTPEDKLFDQHERTFSNGCIRVQKPEELSEFLFKDNASGNWTKQEINAIIENDEWKQVNLEEKIPVYIIYWTAFVEEDGTVNFRENIYGQKIDLEG
ncbi:murein L,D-transpeptidase [soil metagenome]